MGIEVWLEDEDGKPLEYCPNSDAAGDLRWAAWNRADDANRVRDVDEYGDTLLNQLQIPPFLTDAEGLILLVPDDSRRKRAAELVEFVRSVVGRTHTYLRFRGD